jgi:hypothetical protein
MLEFSAKIMLSLKLGAGHRSYCGNGAKLSVMRGQILEYSFVIA